MGVNNLRIDVWFNALLTKRDGIILGRSTVLLGLGIDNYDVAGIMSDKVLLT